MADTLSTIANLVVALVAAASAGAAWLGVSAWRRELQGRTEYDLARRALIGVYRIRDAMARVRAPFMAVWEYADRPGRPPDQRLSDADDLAYAYQDRWRSVQEAKSALDVDLLEAEAIWGDLLKEATMELSKCIIDLSVNITQYVGAQRGTRMDPQRMAHVERVIWPMGTDEQPDEYGERLAQVISVFDEKLRRHLRRT